MSEYIQRLEDLLSDVEKKRAKEIRNLFNAATERSELDPLTHLPRRKGVRDAFDRTKKIAERYNNPLAIALIDVDNFKKVNDGEGYRNHTGHKAGDLLAQDTASLLKNILRPGDFIGKWGGDEFVALLPLVYDDQLVKLQPPECALAVAERIRQRMKTQTGKTVSIGISVFPYTPLSADLDLRIQHADLAMYAAKQQGRDRCVIYTPELESLKRA